jgi:hypothetical protein
MHTVAGTALWVTAQLLPAAPPPPGLGGALLQELPAIHINPLLDRMMTYSGDTPFTEATVDSVKVCSLSLTLSLSLSLSLSLFLERPLFRTLTLPLLSLSPAGGVFANQPKLEPRCVHCGGALGGARVSMPGGGGLLSVARKLQEVQGAVGAGALPRRCDRLRRRLPVRVPGLGVSLSETGTDRAPGRSQQEASQFDLRPVLRWTLSPKLDPAPHATCAAARPSRWTRARSTTCRTRARQDPTAP